jgi:hypothetical protein
MVGSISENFIDTEFIQWLLWFWDQAPNKVDTGQRIRAFLNHKLSWNRELHKKLRSLIEPHEHSFDITTAYLSKDYAPGGVHSDGWIPAYPEGAISSTYLVPLISDDTNHTVIFSESSEEAVTFNSAMGMGNSGIISYKQSLPSALLSTDQQNISIDLYNKYLTHLPYEKLNGLTIDCVLPWKVGSSIFWPRKHFHCSADYDRSSNRVALILMTCKV